MTPHTITETIRFLLTMRIHSDIYFSPAVLHTPTLPSQYAMLNIDSSEKGKQDQFSGTVKGSGTSSSSSEPVLETNVRCLYSYTAVDSLTMEPSLDSLYGKWRSKLCN